ncbi:MAG: beta-ketoacyl-ACP synthase II [Alphaproteobacteria bacterium]|nr:beta-ketoacyl-ACP synthase II [Alphaproteobacteria bacterium]
MRRVVVTGMGMLSPMGRGVETTWQGLIQGKSAITPVTKYDVSESPAKIAGQIPRGTGEGQFDPDSVMTPKEQRRVDPFILYGLCAGTDAMEDSGWKPETEEDHFRSGVMIGAGIGGLSAISDSAVVLKEQGPRRISPFFIPSCLINLISGQLSIKYGLYGPNHSCVTACATGTHAIGDAARLIMWGDADVMVAGGAEAAVHPLAMAGFAQAKALSTHYNDTPEKASRPWDKGHDGFVMGEGAGVVVLEEYEHAKKRGAKIYGEIAGYGLSGDGYHVTAPAPDSRGSKHAMRMALKNGGMNVEDVGYINAHGTSTPAGDILEVNAVKDVFGPYATKVSMSSTKSSIGHLLGAAGAVEAIFCLKALQEGIMPPTLNLEDPIEGAEDMDLVALKAKERKLTAVMSNSFGFGGTNASVIFKAV